MGVKIQGIKIKVVKSNHDNFLKQDCIHEKTCLPAHLCLPAKVLLTNVHWTSRRTDRPTDQPTDGHILL